ncbi:MAG: hypothetical protein GXY38_10175 [Planctomycetes bacterium]|nr:hypothetical protein [Planctomycetota bacterium]
MSSPLKVVVTDYIEADLDWEQRELAGHGIAIETHQLKQACEDDAIRAIGRSAVATAASGPADFDFADHKVLIEDMARAVSTGADPAITAASARNTLETALAMYKSAKLGKDVTLPLADEEDIW